MQKKKQIIEILIIICVISAIFSLTGIIYVKKINDTLKTESYSYLNEVTQQSSKAINNKLDGDMRMLRAMAVMLSNTGSIDVNFWVDALKNEGLFEEFERIGIILPDGRGYGSDVSGTNFSDREYFKQAMAGNYYISDVMIDRTSKVLSNTYAVPIYNDGKIIGILAAVTTTDAYKEILFNEVFNGRSYSYIVKKDGGLVVGSNHKDSEKNLTNIFDDIQAEAHSIGEMKQNMLEGLSGTLDYMRGEKLQFLNYTPLGINDWYVISVVPNEVVQEKSQKIINITIVSCIGVFLIFTGLILGIIWTQYRTKNALYRVAYYDDVTGIANKNLFRKMAEAEIVKNKREYAYVILNIYKFKIINDKFGFIQGDLLLKHIARIADKEFTGNEIASRFYADEFHLLCEYNSKSELEHRLMALVDKIADFTIVADASYNISMGFGVYVIKNSEMSIGTIGDKAALAIKKVKGNYLIPIFFYNDDIRNQIIEEQEIENGMEDAIMNEEFKVYLQPKYSLNTEEIKGAEALVRWIHPKKGLITPDEFIPVFEKNGFVTTLDMYMLEHVCKRLRIWIDEGEDILPISINQSRLHLHDPNYISNIMSIMGKYDIPTNFIEFEITESAFFEDTEQLISIINQLHELGFKVSMDDFGSGYSSLNMLQELMVDVLKVDRKFFNESANTARGRKIVNNIISMASDLNIKVVAEGVETIEQLEFLRQTDCDLVQGFYFAKPMPISEFEEALKNK